MRLSHEQKSLQGVFRVPKPSKASNLSTLSDQSPSSRKQQSFRPRKTHKKSRKGCDNCKRRHVRCGEEPGGCLRCKNHGIECDYLTALDDRTLEMAPIPIAPSAKSSSLVSTPCGTETTFHMISQRSLTPLSRQLSASPIVSVGSPPGQKMHDTQSILHHFHTLTAMTCGSPASQAINQSSVISAAIETPYLMHALLGLATAHLRHLFGRDTSETRTRLKVVECFYWAQAFEGFRRELAGTGESCSIVATRRSNVTRYNMDPLLSTLMLVSMHQFSYRDYEHDESDPADKSFIWIEDRSQRDAALKWLGIEAGFKGMIGAMAPWLGQSFWLPIMRTVDVDGEADLQSWILAPSLDETETRLAQICGVTAESDRTNPYYTNLETLVWCRAYRPIGPEHFNNMITFVARTTPAYRQLVLDRDTAALVLLLYWLQLMNDIGQWWIVERCQAEIRAIVTFLYHRDDMGRTDLDVLSLLEAPAKTVGLDMPFDTVHPFR